MELTGVVEITPIAELYLDDTLLVAEGTPAGSLTDFVVSVDHPYAANSGTYADQSVTFILNRSNGSYVLASAFGGDRNSQLLAERQRQLNSMTLQGLANGSNEVLTETLNVIGQTWMQQTQLNSELIGSLSDHRVLRHHRFGIVGQEDGYFVDVKAQFVSMLPETVTATSGGFQASGFIASAMEHSVLEQLQGISNPGVSTIKIFALNNQNSGKFFLANQANFGTIQPQLTGYTASDLSQFQSAVNQSGTSLILPENGQVTLNSWTGKGYVNYRVNGTARSLGMTIGGGLNGGFVSNPVPVDTAQVQAVSNNKSKPSVTKPKTPASDPVDLNTGAYFSQMTDISIAGAEPRGLSFTRFYNSQQVDQDTTGLGRGWTHNYNIYLSEYSNVEAALGKRTPVDAASLIVSAFVTRDLMEATQPTIQSWIAGALVADWATDQLLTNAVIVHLGDQGLTYRELPDGSYASPPGVTTALVKLGDGTFELRERFGTVIAFNSNNKISSLTDVDGNTLTFTYDVAGKLTQVKDAYNRKLTVGYAGNQLTSVSDENSRSVVYTQTGGDLTGVTGLENANWVFTYDPLHRLKTVVNPVSVTLVDNTYDDSDRVITQLAPRKAGTATYKMRYTGLTSIDEDPLGNRITYHYDYFGRKVAIENALGDKTTTEFDSQNHPVKRVDPRGNATTVLYDANNNIRFINDPLNQQTENVYDAQYRLTNIIDPLSNTTQFGYDAEHHLVWARDALLNQASSTYLTNGQTATSTDGRGTITSYTYDTLGYPDTTKVGAHPVVNVGYDAIGRLQSLTDQAGATTSFVYDNRGRVTQATDPLSKQTNSSYDSAGRLVSVTDRNSDTISVGYTPSGKLDSITYPGPTTVSYSYDSRDNLTTMVDSLGTTTNVFDAANRLTSITDANGFTLSYGYDEAGNVTSLTYPGNKTVTYTYDALNRLKTVTHWLGQTATYSYDAAGRLTQAVNFNGSITNYGYDNANRLTSLSNQKADTSALNSHSFTLDASGNRVQEVINEPLPPSNLATETINLNYNATRNRLQSTTLDSFLYDFEGQLSDKSSTPFTFDYAHRLTGISTSIQYNYDGAGNRLNATRNGIVTKYLYDATGNLLAEADSTNTITQYYIHGAGLLAMVQGSNVYSYHYNAVGSTVAITDNSQSIVNAYSYGPYGRILNEMETITQPFKYVGQYGVMFEPGVEFYYMRARYYDPTTGRFISEDPIGMEGGLNLYAYASGNPVLFSDPSGLYTFGVSFNVGGGAGYGGTTGINFVFDTNGGFEMQRIIGGGSYVGASGGFSINLEATNADTIQQLRGFGLQAGASYGEGLFVEGGTIAGPGYAGVYGGVGVGGGATPAAGYGYTTYTTPYGAPGAASAPSQRGGCSPKCF